MTYVLASGGGNNAWGRPIAVFSNTAIMKDYIIKDFNKIFSVYSNKIKITSRKAESAFYSIMVTGKNDDNESAQRNYECHVLSDIDSDFDKKDDLFAWQKKNNDV